MTEPSRSLVPYVPPASQEAAFRNVLNGYDTIECAYYLQFQNGAHELENFFKRMEAEKEALRTGKHKQRGTKLGNQYFMLFSTGTSSGYPYKIENTQFSIQFGEFNKPNFYVTFSSYALWHHGALELHKRFLKWAASLGFKPYEPERLSRVDFAFDYHIPNFTVDQDDFTSAANKDSRYRQRGTVQTMQFGTSPVLLRVYDKSAEIAQQSGKTWFHPMWCVRENVWRFEWEIRKAKLRDYGIVTFEDMWRYQGKLLHWLTTQHTTLRLNNDGEIHPLWLDMVECIKKIQSFEPRICDENALLEERLMNIAISVYGYLKRVSAINILQQNAWEDDLHGAFELLRDRVEQIHDPLTWPIDIKRKATEMRLGK